MRTFKVTIRGVAPLLQHNPQHAMEKREANRGGTRKVHVNSLTPREEAEQVAYRDEKSGVLFFPSTWIFGNLRDTAAGHKQTGSRKNMKYVIAAGVRVQEFNIPLINGDGKSPAKNFEVDSRRVVIPATKGSVMHHRPRIDEWGATFHLLVNDGVIDPSTVKQFLDEGGVMVGIGDFRPAKFGPFGTFTVTEWTEVGATAGAERKASKKALEKTVPSA